MKKRSFPSKAVAPVINPTISAALLATAIGSPGALAQGNEQLALEEVIVTARKREESIQDVPVSVTSISKELREASLRRLDDVQSFAPNVYIRTTAGIPGGAAISIRGVSYQEFDKTLDPSIGVIMDGLYLGTSSGALLNNFDVKRIEVLRGPQGTLFGKNTTGGVLNVIRGDVTMDWNGDFSVTLGDDGREDIKGVLNVPIIKEKMGIKLFANQIKSDGWIENVTVNEDAFGDDKKTYGFAAQWRPTDNFDIKLHYEHNDDETDTGANAQVSQRGQDLDCIIEGAWPAPSCEDSDKRSDKDHVTTNDRNLNDSEYDTVILTMNWDIGPGVITSITGNRDMDEQYRFEFDGGAHEFLYFDYLNEWEQFSQELRFTSNFEGNFQFVGGLYYWEVDYLQDWDVYQLLYTLDRTGLLVPGVLPPGAAGFNENTVSRNGQWQDTTSYAVFAQGDWQVAEKWTLTAGIRYTYEEKDFTGGNGIVYTKVPGEPRPQFDTLSYEDDWSEPTGKLGFTYDFSDETMIFGSWSEGFKSGGFFGRQAQFEGFDPSYDPEYVTVWELGMKSTWLDGQMIFNPTIFFNDYEDKQEDILIFNSNSDVSTAIRNVGELEIWGVELEWQYQVTEAWNVRANYGYLDAEYKDYTADLNGDGVETDNTDLQPRNTPEHTFGFHTTYTADVGPGELIGFLSYRWRDEIEVLANRSPLPGSSGNDPLGHLDSIHNLDLTLSYLWSDGRYRLTAYGRNVTDERERIVSRITDLTTWAIWNQGRHYGVEFAISF